MDSKEILNKSFEDIDVPFLKEYLRIEEDFNDDDILLETCIISAKSYIHNYLGEEVEIPQEATMALLILCSYWYQQRTITSEGEAKRELPYVFEGLLSQSRNWKVGLE